MAEGGYDPETNPFDGDNDRTPLIPRREEGEVIRMRHRIPFNKHAVHLPQTNKSSTSTSEVHETSFIDTPSGSIVSIREEEKQEIEERIEKVFVKPNYKYFHSRIGAFDRVEVRLTRVNSKWYVIDDPKLPVSLKKILGPTYEEEAQAVYESKEAARVEEEKRLEINEIIERKVEERLSEARKVRDGKVGERGRDGERGMMGKDGKVGERGRDGKVGERGKDGKDGKAGERGMTGKDGKDGKAGEMGMTGKDGKDGKVGKAGEMGMTGKDGKEGKVGKAGEMGKAGERGKDGKAGEMGKAGERGKDGKDGERGKDGKAGERGIMGIRGMEGKEGEAGIDGIDGKDGKVGERGRVGERGMAGRDGEAGDMEMMERVENLVRELDEARNEVAGSRERLAVAEREEEVAMERLSTRQRIKAIFKKYGFTVFSIATAIGVVIGVIVSNLKAGLTKVAKGLGNGLKELGKKLGEILPGMIGAIASFLFRTAGEVIGFLAKNAWLLIVGLVVLAVEQFKKKSG